MVRGILTVPDAFGDVSEIMLCQRVRRTAARASAKVGYSFEGPVAKFFGARFIRKLRATEPELTKL
jgi:hypothetical protein